MDPFKDRIRPLFDRSGMSDKEIEESLGLPKGVIYKWGTGKYKSYRSYYDIISKYFDVSVDYLIGITDEPSNEKNNTMNIFFDKIQPLFEKSGLSDRELEEKIGLPRSTIYNWKSGRNKAYAKYCSMIASFFGVSSDYLLGLTDDPSTKEQGETDIKNPASETETGKVPTIQDWKDLLATFNKEELKAIIDMATSELIGRD